MAKTTRFAAVLLLGGVLDGNLPAEQAREPASMDELRSRAVVNWSAPLYWSPGATAESIREKSTNSTPPIALPFIAIPPCRVADTRVASFPPGFGPPSLVGGAARTFDLPGQCGLPTEALAYSLNLTVVPPAHPPFSFLSIYPTGGSRPPVSTLNWGAPGTSSVYFNAAIVPAGTGGAVDVFVSSGTDLIIDVNGYYANNLTSQNGQFSLISDVNPGDVLTVQNADSATSTGAIFGITGCGDCSVSTFLRYGVLGVNFIPPAFGFLGATDGTNTYGVYASGDYGGTGAKYFVEPHPQDASKVIRYVALEGPEAGTYFRGTSETHGGRAVIDVPETFRLVTEQVGLTVQLTPIGDLAILAVVSEDLNRIVVESSKDVPFHYQVNGVRHSFAGFDPVSTSSVFAPGSANETMPAYLTDAEKRSLISNGTYNADGTVNVETARAQGWDKRWQAPPSQ
jgi:hypothetical protein